MANIHRVIKYSNMSYNEVLQLPCDIFQLMLKNSIVTELMQSEEGRAEIERYKIENTLTPDLDKLSKRFNVLSK